MNGPNDFVRVVDVLRFHVRRLISSVQIVALNSAVSLDDSRLGLCC